MKNHFKKIIFLIILSFVLITPPVLAQNLQDAFKNPDSYYDDEDPGKGAPLEIVSSKAGYDPTSNFNSMIGKIILTTLSMLGIIFLILLIYAGFLWMTAAGNEQQVTKAKSMITTAIIGLIIVLSAYSISYFVLGSLQKGALQEGPTTEI